MSDGFLDSEFMPTRPHFTETNSEGADLTRMTRTRRRLTRKLHDAQRVCCLARNIRNVQAMVVDVKDAMCTAGQRN